MRQLALLAFIIIFTVACEHNSVGYEELERPIGNPQYLELGTTSTGRWSYRKFIPLGTSSMLILGKNAQYESRVLLSFNLPDTTIALDSLLSAKLILYTRQAGAVQFSIYPTRPSSPWREAFVTWTRMDENVPWDSAGGDFYPQALAQGISITPDSTVINLNLNLLDTLFNHASGVILIPENFSDSFAVAYAKEFGSKGAKLVLQFPRTTKTYPVKEDAHIITTADLPGVQDYWLGSGVVYRTLFKFNLASLPQEPLTITFAELYLSIQDEFSIFDTLKIVAKRVTDSMPFSELTRFSSTVSASKSYIVSQDSTLVIDLRNLVQFWVTNPDSNFGIVLTTEPENFGLVRLKINPQPPSVRLKIGYITAPPGRF
ncbi:MAG: hypothetical protein ABIK10_01755 [candidate division WOR-3 bacterium]